MSKKTLFSLVVVIWSAFIAQNAWGSTEVTVGVLAHRGVPKAIKLWQPTIDYLNESIPGYRFKLEPRKLKALKKETAGNQFDFVLTNPGQYVELESIYGITRLATLRNLRQGQPYDAFGSVIFTRSDNPAIRSLKDVEGSRFAGVGKGAFGAFQIAWFELKKIGIDPFTDTSELVFTGVPQDKVVFAVRDGKADVGTVRTDVMERMVKDGLIDLNDYRLIQEKKAKGFPFRLSTDLYPEWAFSRTERTPEGLGKEVAKVLLSLTADHSAAKAGHYAGWEVPGNYNSVHELYKAIQYGPYKDFGKFDLQDVILKYWPVLGLFVLLLIFAIYHALHVSHTNQQLKLAKDQAESANIDKSRFLASASHDIRQPLQAIRLFVSALEISLHKNNANTDQETLDNLNYIRSSVDALSELLDSLLDISKLEAQVVSVNIVSFPMQGLLDNTRRMFEAAAQEKGLELRISPCSCYVSSDPVLLQRMIDNLVSNALRYTNSGTILIGARRSEGNVRIDICDTGIGIDQQHFDEIFTEFRQIGNPARQREKGFGLGLSIVRRTADLLGHKLDVESTLGKGSTFSITLPRSGEALPDPVKPDNTLINLSADNRGHLLVLDDDPLVLSAMDALLRNWGYSVTLAESAEDALILADDEFNKPDLVIFDYHLPGDMSGLDVYRYINQQREKEIPGIIISGATEADHFKLFEESGLDYMTKPVDPTTLKEHLNKLLV